MRVGGPVDPRSTSRGPSSGGARAAASSSADPADRPGRADATGDRCEVHRPVAHIRGGTSPGLVDSSRDAPRFSVAS